MGLRDFTLSDVIERNARLYANRAAFVFGTERVTHADYAARVGRLAQGLAQAGIVPGDRIAVLSQNSLEFVELYGAAARLGAILVPVNWRLSAEEIAYIVGHAAPKIVVADPDNQSVLRGIRESLPAVERWYGIGGGTDPFADYAKLIEADARVAQPSTGRGPRAMQLWS